jgi:AraC family transcriptional regulator
MQQAPIPAVLQHPSGAPPDGAGLPLIWVDYIPRVANFADPRESERIQIILPGEHSALCVGCRSADGHDRTASLRAHQVAVIPARRAYSLYSARPGDEHTACDALVIGLDDAFFLQTARPAAGSGEPQIVERLGVADPFLREVGNGLRAGTQKPGGPYLDSLATVVAMHLARNYCEDRAKTEQGGGLPPAKLQRVQSFIDDHIGDSLHVDQIAASVHMSPFHFARLFKKATGHSPHVYLTLQRIEHAKRLLRTSDLPLIEVGTRSGFHTQGHFTGVFHRYAGVTPRVYRVQSQQDGSGAGPKL